MVLDIRNFFSKIYPLTIYIIYLSDIFFLRKLISARTCIFLLVHILHFVVYENNDYENHISGTVRDTTLMH